MQPQPFVMLPQTGVLGSAGGPMVLVPAAHLGQGLPGFGTPYGVQQPRCSTLCVLLSAYATQKVQRIQSGTLVAVCNRLTADWVAARHRAVHYACLTLDGCCPCCP